MGRPLLRGGVRSTKESWMEAVDEEAKEGDLDSLRYDKEAVEFPLPDRLVSLEIKEDVEDTEEVGLSLEEVREEEGVRGGEAALSGGCF
ncbi:hypothetical protein CesoFtcFv8_016107 [Champsocephalus esox]|uniref:Uncharacterized protein n=1 Tax=Champsocephalus esox TaxID=159716 RepID=A0AAN8BM27_9TELE|nr:hypothetical protein CesoFtcFv8_016107 [Champsocephalus esox]